MLKTNIATILLDKYGNKFDDEYYSVSMPLLSIPACNEDMIGYAEVVERKRKRNSEKKRRPRLGIGCLCEEAIEFLERYDPNIREKIEVCDTIGFVEVRKVDAAATPYQQFMKKCVQTKEGDTRSRIRECAKLWREIKDDAKKLKEWGVVDRSSTKLF